MVSFDDQLPRRLADWLLKTRKRHSTFRSDGSKPDVRINNRRAAAMSAMVMAWNAMVRTLILNDAPS